MENAIKFLSLCCLAFGMTIFVSCGSDDDTELPDEILCDSLTAQINMYSDSLDLILSVETFGYNGPLNYIWSNGETTSSISVPLDDEGTYSVTVTADGAPDCEATGSIDLTNSVDCSALSSNITLTGGSNPTATLEANASGGTAPYSYIWTTGETTSSVTVSEDGTYGVSISDANGCVSASVYNYSTVVNSPCDTNFYATFNIIDTVGVILIYADVQGGTAPYTYEWSNGETGNVIETTVSGNYSVTITDAEGCTTISSTGQVTWPCDNFNVTIYLNADSLGTGQDYLTAITNGGTWPVSYNWSTGESGGSIEVTNATGNFSVTATDANGCVAEDDIDL